MVTISVRQSGPYVIEGDNVKIIDWNGNEYRPVNLVRFALCRCGRSTTKPFCDGSHSIVGFRATEAAAQDTGSDPTR